MATVEAVARHVAGVTMTEDDLLLIGTWINERWKELAGTTTLKTLRRTGELRTQPVVSDGTVAVTDDSVTVVGAGTAWTSGLAGASIRLGSVWFVIAQVISATELRLAVPYVGETGTGVGYHIVRTAYRLDPEARELGVFWHQRLRRPLGTSSEIGMSYSIPARFQVSNVPAYATEKEPDIDGVRRVEIYPYTRRAELINYLYWVRPMDLDFKDELPAFIDIEAFREGVMVDVLRNRMFKAMMDKDMRAAEIYRNDYRAQETRWMRDHRQRVIKKDSGAADREFFLFNSRNHPMGWGGDTEVINDAWGQVWFGRV